MLGQTILDGVFSFPTHYGPCNYDFVFRQQQLFRVHHTLVKACVRVLPNGIYRILLKLPVSKTLSIFRKVSK